MQKTAIQKLIEIGQKGGFVMSPKYTYFDGQSYNAPCIEKILLEPSFFQAVGRELGWTKTDLFDDLDGKPYQQDTALRKQVEMIYALWEGKSLESFAESLLNKG